MRMAALVFSNKVVRSSYGLNAAHEYIFPHHGTRHLGWRGVFCCLNGTSAPARTFWRKAGEEC
ncbi:hypothetical protein APS_0573 [Acetobacter pasteurianus subsp. pasteurianus LMG 1262 = NBRC 106471]|nr:hypothetical protein APS_0573 [Acetobacter pasteurianus subsp. pasteurianus LMG 1262 = NBRC 106471]